MDISALAASLQHELQASLRSTGVVPPLSATHPFVQHALLPLVHSHSPTPSHEQCVSILRVLRVACAGSLPNALLLIELGVPSAVVQLVTSSYAQYLEDKQHSYDQTAPSEGTHDATITASASVSVSVSDAEIKNLLTVASQVLANFSSCRDLHCSNEFRPAAASLWAMGGVELFSSLLNMAVSLSAHNALSAIFAALHSCLLCPEVDAATELTSSRQICCQMALSVVDMKFAEMHTKDSANASASKSNNTSSENNANVEWFQIVVARLLKTGHVVRLLQVVKRTAAVLADITSASECFAVTMTHEEIIYLCALDTIISDNSTLEEVTQSEIYFNHLKQLLQYIASLLIPAPGMISMHYPDVLTVDASSVAIDEKYALYLSSRRPILTPENDKAGLGVNAATTNLDLDSLSTPAASVCVNLLAKFSALSNSVLGERIATFSEQKEVFGSILKQELLEAGIMNICCSYLTGLNKIKTGKINKGVCYYQVSSYLTIKVLYMNILYIRQEQ